MSSDFLKLAAVLGIVAINGFFVAAEFALVSARKTRIDQMALDGNRMAKIVQKAMSDPNRFISASQVGITMASLGLGWIAEPALSSILMPVLEPIFGDSARISAHVVAGVIAYLFITLLHIVLGEQVPKMIALQRSESTILATAGPVAWISVPFRPMISLLYWLTSLALKPLKLEWQGEHHLVYSEDELKMLVTASHQSGYLEQSEQEIINRVFGFADVLAEQIMVPRTEMMALQIDTPIDEVVAAVTESGHGRYPVYRENLDDILGIFYAKDLYRLFGKEDRARFGLRRLMRPPLMIHQSMPLDDLLTHMKRQRTHIAIVIDEYGGTAGMVTLEDILERIVGDVQDEFEQQGDDIQVLSNGDIRVSGLLSIEEINERFELEIDDPYYNTIGGFVFGQLGRRPEVGDQVEIDDHLLRVDALDGLRIDRLLIVKLDAGPHSDPELLPLQEVES
jgi:putative hemolysin